MSMTSLFLYCLAILLKFPVLFQSAEAVPPISNRDRAIRIYNAATDPCTGLNAFSSKEELDAADRACSEGFLALDAINANTCGGWKESKCRFFHETFQRLCSCKVSTSISFGLTRDQTKSFRDCALSLWLEELYGGEVVPSSGPQGTFNIFESSAQQAAQSSRDSLNTGGSNSASTSHGAKTTSVRKRKAASKHDAGPSKKRGKDAGGPAFPCEVCNREYKSVKSLNNHKRSHEEDLKCRICKQTYSSRTNYHRHIKDAHKGDKAALSEGSTKLQELVEAYNARKRFKCEICEKRFLHRKSLRDHLISHEAEATFCTLCNRTYSTVANYQAHMKAQHSEEEEE